MLKLDHKNIGEMVDKLLENQSKEQSNSSVTKEKEMPPIDEWIKNQKFKTTNDIEVPDLLLDQVIGQDKAVDIVRKAAEQKRHVMLIGDPGTGKSMVARAMTAFLPKENNRNLKILFLILITMTQTRHILGLFLEERLKK